MRYPSSLVPRLSRKRGRAWYILSRARPQGRENLIACGRTKPQWAVHSNLYLYDSVALVYWWKSMGPCGLWNLTELIIVARPSLEQTLERRSDHRCETTVVSRLTGLRLLPFASENSFHSGIQPKTAPFQASLKPSLHLLITETASHRLQCASCSSDRTMRGHVATLRFGLPTRN